MYLFRTVDESAELMCLPGATPWYLIADQGNDGNAHLYMFANGKEFPIHDGTELVEMYPGLQHYDILELYDAVIKDIYTRLAQTTSNCIDLDDVIERLLEEYVPRWQADGIIWMP